MPDGLQPDTVSEQMTVQTLDILVCDDESALREALRQSFQREGHRVLAVPDGRAAIDHASTSHFDVVLLDVALGPGSPDGYEVCRELRARRNGVPIIMLTALDSEADAVLGLEAGADDYVTKPFGLAELRSRIRAVLRRAGPTVLVRGVGVRRQTAGAVGHHRRQLRQQQAHDVAADRDHDDHRHGCGAQLGDHHRGDSGDEDRPGEADHERAPPIRLLLQTTARVVELLVLTRHRASLRVWTLRMGSSQNETIITRARATGNSGEQWRR